MGVIAFARSMGAVIGFCSTLSLALVGACSSTTLGHDKVDASAAQPQPIIVPLQGPRFMLPAGTAPVVGTKYALQIPLEGGKPPYTVKSVAGSPPPVGLSFNAAGQLTGTPTTAAAYDFEITIEDAAGTTLTGGTISITVAASGAAPGFTIQDVTVPSFGQDQDVGYRLIAWGSGMPWTFDVSGLPDGLTFDPATGTISGTTSATGTSSITISATDVNGKAASGSPVTLSLPVLPPVQPSSGGMETWTVFRPDGAEATVTINGGAISQVSGAAWMVFDNTGQCSFPVPISGQVVGDQWQFSANGAGGSCGAYMTQCFAQGAATGPGMAGGSIQCTNVVPGGQSVVDKGNWTATRQ
jgi:hypothetical protein